MILSGHILFPFIINLLTIKIPYRNRKNDKYLIQIRKLLKIAQI